MKNKIKWLIDKGWDEELIIQQLCVDYEIDNLEDIITDIKIKVRNKSIIETLATAGAMIGVMGYLMKSVLGE